MLILSGMIGEPVKRLPYKQEDLRSMILNQKRMSMVTLAYNLEQGKVDTSISLGLSNQPVQTTWKDPGL